LRTGEGPVITVSGGVVPIHTIEWLEIDNNGNAIGAADNGIIYHPGNKDLVVANVIVHDAVEDNRSVAGISHVSGGGGGVYNSIVYDISVAQTNDDVSGILAADVTQILNNTIYNITGQTGGGATAWGINYSDVADMEVKNNIVTDTSGADTNLDYSDSSPSNATTTNNLDSDGTAPGANPQNNKTSANQFVSTAGGSEDLHIKAGADAIDAGVDLGTTPTGVEIDINGRDRDAEGDTWDIGAHELVVAAGGGLNQILGGGLLVA